MNRLIFFTLYSLQLIALDANKFYQLLFDTPPDWMLRKIEQDLAPFSRELNRKFLNELFAKKGEEFRLVRVRVEDGVLYFQKSRRAETHPVPPMILDGLQRLHSLAPLPDLDFLFTANDTLHYREPNWPIFSESKFKDRPGILYPDRFALKGYQPEKTLVLEGNLIYPWELKINLLFFRGSDTAHETGDDFFESRLAGIQFNSEEWRKCARPKLVALSLKNPDRIDAKFWHTLHYRPMIESARQEGFLVDEFVSLRDHPRYRYLMDIDGNCASCPRTALIFHSNSVIFKQITKSVQWFYDLLIPYIHFIPVKEDLSDLLNQIEWAEHHQEECKFISEQAHHLVQDILSEERVYQYFYLLLKEYAKKQEAFYY